jgi:hypothetical protein
LLDGEEAKQCIPPLKHSSQRFKGNSKGLNSQGTEQESLTSFRELVTATISISGNQFANLKEQNSHKKA